MMPRAAALAIVFAATPIAGFASMPEPKPEKPGKAVVAMSNVMPPYTYHDAKGNFAGFFVDVMNAAVPPQVRQNWEMVEMAWGSLQTAVPLGLANISVGTRMVENKAPKQFFSQPVFAMRNVAITKVCGPVPGCISSPIENIEDFGDREVYAFYGANEVLGPDFAARYGEGGTHSGGLYDEFPNQERQVETFWESSSTEVVAVMDIEIFKAVTMKLGVKSEWRVEPVLDHVRPCQRDHPPARRGQPPRALHLASSARAPDSGKRVACELRQEAAEDGLRARGRRPVPRWHVR